MFAFLHFNLNSLFIALMLNVNVIAPLIIELLAKQKIHASFDRYLNAWQKVISLEPFKLESKNTMQDAQTSE